MTTCINLKERFGQRCRVLYEESRTAEHGSRSHVADPWLLVIPCRHGHIYPHGGDQLAASTNNRGAIAKRLAALPCVRVVQDGDDGINVVFHVDDFPAVAAIMKPKRLRRLSAEHRAKLAEAGRTALAQHRNSGVDSKGRKRDPAA
jgi:hypothetical protein